jgi:hypothetical protein
LQNVRQDARRKSHSGAGLPLLGGVRENSAGFPACQQLSGIRALQFINVDLLHAKHCLHRPLRIFRIGVIEHLDHSGGSDLP